MVCAHHDNFPVIIGVFIHKILYMCVCVHISQVFSMKWT